MGRPPVVQIVTSSRSKTPLVTRGPIPDISYGDMSGVGFDLQIPAFKIGASKLNGVSVLEGAKTFMLGVSDIDGLEVLK